MGRAFRRRFAISFFGATSFSMFLAACSLPDQQLTFPSAILGPLGKPEPTIGTRTAGAPLSARGPSETTDARVFEGSGKFVSYAPGVRPEGRADNGSYAKGSDKDGFTINLVGASVPEVAKAVLGDILGVNYSVSEKVKAAITLTTVRPVDKAALYEIFEAVLRAEGVAVVVENGLFKIVPLAEAAASGVPLRGSGSFKRNGAVGLTTTIVPLRYVSAGEMERILKSVAPQSSILRVDTVRNLLVISGTQSEMSSIGELISTFDVDWMKGMSFALLPVEAANPEAIAAELDTIFANDRDGPSKGVVRFIGNKRLKSVLVMSSRSEYLRKAKMWVNRIDMASRQTRHAGFRLSRTESSCR